MKELVIEAARRNLMQVQSFIDEQLEESYCPMLTQMTIDLAVEELFVNISGYAYGQDKGVVTVQVTVHDEPLSVEITFIDSCGRYEPPAQADPDHAASLKERSKGGPGIFIAKNTMDSFSYEYKDGKNIFTIKKNL